jgi:hypothetical protein
LNFFHTVKREQKTIALKRFDLKQKIKFTKGKFLFFPYTFDKIYTGLDKAGIQDIFFLGKKKTGLPEIQTKKSEIQTIKNRFKLFYGE